MDQSCSVLISQYFNTVWSFPSFFLCFLSMIGSTFTSRTHQPYASGNCTQPILAAEKSSGMIAPQRASYMIAFISARGLSCLKIMHRLQENCLRHLSAPFPWPFSILSVSSFLLSHSIQLQHFIPHSSSPISFYGETLL